MLPWQRQYNAARAIGNQGERGFRWAASKIFFDSLAEGASRPKGAGKRHEYAIQAQPVNQSRRGMGNRYGREQ